jgi:predicted TIM-barrel fold metal-dependent hydrolase
MIFDCHAHIFPEALVDRAMVSLSAGYGVEPIGRATADGLLTHMDACGVDQALAVSVATKPSQVESINDWLLSLDRDRLVPFGAMHPYYDDMESEIQRLLGAGVKGIKLQPYFQGYRLDDPRTLAMFECIGDRMIVLLHGGNEIIPIPDVQPTPKRVRNLHRRFPQVRLIVAHLGASGLWDDVEKYLVGEDVVFDASYVFDICSDEQIARIIRNHGPERIVWGSDFPWQPQSQGLAGVNRLPFTEEQKQGILSGNLLRLLGMER